MSHRSGMFEDVAFANLLWFALLIGIPLLLVLFAPELISHSNEARRATTAAATVATPTAVISH